jgi:hypothetical protein
VNVINATLSLIQHGCINLDDLIGNDGNIGSCYQRSKVKTILIKESYFKITTFITRVAFVLNELGKLRANWNLQRLHIKCHDIVFAATLVTVINDVLTNVVFRDRLFDICCSFTIEGEI